MDEKLLTMEQLCDKLQVTRQTIYNWIEAGKISAIKVGPKMIRFEQKEVDRFIEAAKTQQPAA